MDVSTLERSVLLLKMSTQGPELHLDVSGQQWPVLLLDLFTLLRPVLPWDLSTH
jgi:hypothetical protein